MKHLDKIRRAFGHLWPEPLNDFHILANLMVILDDYTDAVVDDEARLGLIGVYPFSS